jgi:hypothetical protein
MPSLAKSPCRPEKPAWKPADVFRQINAARHAATREKVNAALAEGHTAIKVIARHTGVSVSVVKSHLRELGILTTPAPPPRPSGRKRAAATTPEQRLYKRRLAEFHELLATYERRRARGVIDADLADDIAWTMEAELKIGVYDRHGVRYRVVAGELVRDSNYRPAPRIYVGKVKTEDEREARRAA